MLDVILIDKLADVLEKEVLLYSEFLEVSKRKTDIIINGKVTELEDAIKIEQSFSIRMQKLETEREQVIQEIAAKLGIKPSELTVTWIAENNSELMGIRRLKSSRKSIMAFVDEIKKVNEINSKLINNSLEYINFSVNLITSADNSGSKYGNDGKEGKVDRRSLFDVKL